MPRYCLLSNVFVVFYLQTLPRPTPYEMSARTKSPLFFHVPRVAELVILNHKNHDRV